MTDQLPVNLEAALGQFDELWSPHVAATFNAHDARVAKFLGEYVWHAHDSTDEFFMVLAGELEIALRDSPGSERTVSMAKGAVFVVPKGTEHKPMAPTGASVLMIEASGTVSVGDRHDEVPDYIDVTTGRSLPS
ncbi:cupin domain-containing protein [Rhodococcus sp. NPDC058521]|uniref:cupin domain-containing protein n=1 Tax=Rhodococcus sp. NPDC058521 TaxID=3346536 RepID=UPI00364DE4D9